MDCSVCGSITHNLADFNISFGRKDHSIQVCKWCEQDLTLLGFGANQVVRLHHGQKKPNLKHILGPVFQVPFRSDEQISLIGEFRVVSHGLTMEKGII